MAAAAQGCALDGIVFVLQDAGAFELCLEFFLGEAVVDEVVDVGDFGDEEGFGGGCEVFGDERAFVAVEFALGRELEGRCGEV